MPPGTGKQAAACYRGYPASFTGEGPDPMSVMRGTVADICLVTQVTPAKTFCALDPFPRVVRIYDTCMAIPAFSDAHPAKQPDAE